MRGWFWRSSRLAEGAQIGITVHVSGLALIPYALVRTERGPISVEADASQTWRRLDPEPLHDEAGRVLRDVMEGIVVRPPETKSRFGSPSYNDDLRACLGLGPRAALWKGTGYATVRVSDGKLLFRAWRPDGAPGGFATAKSEDLTCEQGAPDGEVGSFFVDIIDRARELARDAKG